MIIMILADWRKLRPMAQALRILAIIIIVVHITNTERQNLFYSRNRPKNVSTSCNKLHVI